MRKQIVFAVPGDPETRTGGYGYDRRVKAELERLGRSVAWLRLPGSWPVPEAADRAAALAMLAGLPEGTVLLADGLAFGVLPAETLTALPLRIVALVHHPLALETGLDAEETRRFEALERAALATARRVIVTSRATGETLTRSYGVAPERITIAEPGTDRAPPARGSGAGAAEILSVGTVTKRKGFLLLFDALDRLAGLDWRCRIVGSLDRDATHAGDVLRAAERFGGRIVFTGEVSEEDLAGFYDRADLFASASLHEGYGMAFAEALARGLPVVGFAAGAVPSVVPSEAGILAPPGDAASLGVALRRLIENPALRRGYAEGARRAAERLPTWEETSRRVDQTLREASE